jgi:hypothetical protein
MASQTLRGHFLLAFAKCVLVSITGVYLTSIKGIKYTFNLQDIGGLAQYWAFVHFLA